LRRIAVLEPVTLYRIVRASGGGRRAGQRHLTPLVGRDEEIAMLMRRWERARQGDGQLALIVGEPGVGKSRLIEEFHARLRDTPHTWVEWSCSQLLRNTPLHPITEWGRIRFGGAEIQSERQLADLENTLALIKLDPAENVPLLAPILDIPLPKERVSTLAPEQSHFRALAVAERQSAKLLELRAATSLTMARPRQAHGSSRSPRTDLTAGSSRASTRRSSGTPGHCSTSWRDPVFWIQIAVCGHSRGD